MRDEIARGISPFNPEGSDGVALRYRVLNDDRRCSARPR
jgi:hypothetical protein